jgi:hypothetical protein
MAARTYQASSVIDAPATQVWEVLVDGAGWTDWDSAVVRVEGTIAPGGTVAVYPDVNPKQGFRVKVVEFEPSRRMVWRGGMPLGLFTGTRTYTLTEQPGGGVRFDMREDYTGPLAGLITRSIPDLAPSFTRFAEGLKHQAESRR